MRKHFTIIAALIACLNGSPAYSDPSQDSKSVTSETTKSGLENKLTYTQIRKNIETHRQVFQIRYQGASRSEKKAIIKESRQFLQNQIIHTLIPAWYGVPWKRLMDCGYVKNCKKRYRACKNKTRIKKRKVNQINFLLGNPSSKTDQWYQNQLKQCIDISKKCQEKVNTCRKKVRYGHRLEDPTKPGAITHCSYFVSTVLKHAGFKVGRHYLSTLLASDIIRTFSPRKSVRWPSTRQSTDKFLKKFKHDKRGPGLYIVGLDMHVGFLIYGQVTDSQGKLKPSGFHFCHADYRHIPQVVRCEPVKGSALDHSRCKMNGKILDDKLMYKWLYNKRIKPHVKR